MTSFIKPRISKLTQHVKELYPGNLVKTVRDEYMLIVCGTGVRGMALAFNVVGECTLDEFAPIKTPVLLYRPQTKDLEMNMDFYCDIRYGIIPIDLNTVAEVLTNDRTSEDMYMLHTYIECFTCLIKGEFGTNDKGQFEFYPNVLHRGVANILSAYNPNAKPNWYAIEFIQKPKEEEETPAPEENKNDAKEPETPEDPEEDEQEEGTSEDEDHTDDPSGGNSIINKDGDGEKEDLNKLRIQLLNEYLEEHDFYSKDTNEKVDILFDAFERYLVDGKLSITAAYTYMSTGSDNGFGRVVISGPRRPILVSKEDFKFVLNSASDSIRKRLGCGHSTATNLRTRALELVDAKPSIYSKSSSGYNSEAAAIYRSGAHSITEIASILRKRHPDVTNVDFEYVAKIAISNKPTKKKQANHNATVSVDEFIIKYGTSVAVSKYRFRDQVIAQLTYMKNRFPNIIDGAETFTTNNAVTDILILYGIYRFTNKMSPLAMINNPNFLHIFEEIDKMSFAEFYKDFAIRDVFDEGKIGMTILPVIKLFCHYKFMPESKKRALVAKLSDKNKSPEEIFESLDQIDKDFFIAIIGRPLSPAQVNVLCDNLGTNSEDIIRVKKAVINIKNRLDHLRNIMTLM